MQAVKSYLQNFRRTSEHSDKRSAHLKQSRELYLPAIAAFIDFMLGRTNHLPDSAGLRVEQDGKCARLVHPSSDWGHHKIANVHSPKNFIFPKTNEPDLNYLAKQLSRLGEIIHSFQPEHLHEKNSKIIYSLEQEIKQKIYITEEIYSFGQQHNKYSSYHIVHPKEPEHPLRGIPPQTHTPKKKSLAHLWWHPKEGYNDEFENTPFSISGIDAEIEQQIKKMSEKYRQHYPWLDKYQRKILLV